MIRSLVRHVLLFCFLTSFQAYAFVFTVSEKQLNTMLKSSFPIVREYQGVSFTFRDPLVSLDPLEKKVFITTNILARQSDKTVKARGTIEGVFDYDTFEKQLRFKKPQLTKFDIIENNIEGTEHIVRTAKQTVGRSLPVIILIDFKQFNFGLGDIIPSDIDITPKGLVITL